MTARENIRIDPAGQASRATRRVQGLDSTVYREDGTDEAAVGCQR